MLSERLERLVLELEGGNKAAFASKLDVNRTTFLGYLLPERQDSIRAVMLIRLLDAYPQVNPVWLLTGQGEMFGTPAFDPATPAEGIIDDGSDAAKLAQVEQTAAESGADRLTTLKTMKTLLDGLVVQEELKSRGRLRERGLDPDYDVNSPDRLQDGS